MYLTYIRRELRRRFKQSLVIALGLAVGIALVVTVSSAAAGVKSAKGQVLHSLYGVGTDMTVTRSLGSGSIGPQRFGGFGSGPSQGGARRISRDASSRFRITSPAVADSAPRAVVMELLHP